MSFDPGDEEIPVRDVYLGRHLGKYELVQRIGEGGMGAVYRAVHADSREEVAIKLIKPGMDTDAILRRFHNERRILGSLDHPNIGRLLDAGVTGEGLPYFVMEYIAGQPIDRYCDKHRLTVEERLRLFLKVCSAAQCAHEFSVVHRDIKPENVLVRGPESGSPGEPMLLDFGIAKILDPAFLANSQQATMTIGAVMTPHYASPEQTRGGAVTPASDIYSLGVLLYELLAGRSPYADVTPAALIQSIRDERPRPASRTLDGRDSSDPAARAIADNRSATVSALRDRLAGDLDAILTKALEKEAARRYASAAELSADVSRHLEGIPVRVRRARSRYAAISPRWRTGAAIGALAVLLFAGYFVARLRTRVTVRPAVAVLGFENSSHQQSAEWLSTALTEMLTTELSAGNRLRTIPGELVSRVKFELALPNAQTLARPALARLSRSLGTDYVVLGSYLALGDGNTQQVKLDLRLQDTKSGKVLAAVAETGSSAELPILVTRAGTKLRRQLGAGEASDNGLGHALPEGAEAARNYAEGLDRLRTFDTLAARDLLRKAVAAAPSHAPSHAALAAALSLLGYDRESQEEARKALELSSGLPREARLSIEGRYLETTRAWDKAVDTFRTLHREYPDNLEYGLQLMAALSQAGLGRDALASLQALRAMPSAAGDPRVDLAEGEAALAAADLTRAGAATQRAAVAGSAQGLRILAANAHLLESRIATQSGDPQRALGAAAESQQLYLAAGHRQGVAMALNESAGVLNQRGDVAGAFARYQEALAVCRAIGDQACIGTDLDSMGVLRRRQGDLEGALETHRQALEIRRAVGDRGGVATSLYNMGNALEGLGDLSGAAQAAAESLEIRNQLGLRRNSALTMSRLGNIRRRQGLLAEALRMTAQGVDTLRAIGDRGGTAMAQANFGLVLFDKGDLAKSRSELEAALAIRREQHDKNNTAQVLAILARVDLAQDKLPQAASRIEESIALRQELHETISLAQSKLVLADILIEQDRASAAEKTAREAAASFHSAAALAWEAEAEVTIARARLARGDARAARISLDSANRLLRSVKDLSLLLRRDNVEARLLSAAGRQAEAVSLLKRALEEARRAGLGGAQLELRLAMTQTDSLTGESLMADARQAGYYLIERRAAAARRSLPAEGLAGTQVRVMGGISR